MHDTPGRRRDRRRPRVPGRAARHRRERPRAALARRGRPTAGAARCGRVRGHDRRNFPIAGALLRAFGAGGAVRHRHLAGGARHAGARRRFRRPDADEGGAGGQCRGHGLPGAGGRHASRAEPASARPGPVLPGRSRRRRLARRHVRDAGQRHQRGALRHHARKRAGPDRGAGRRACDPHWRAGAQIRDRLRPDAAVHRLGRHAGGGDRNPAPPARHPGGDGCRDLPVRQPGGRRGDGDRGACSPASRSRAWNCSTRSSWPPASPTRSWRGWRRCRRCSSSSTAPRPRAAEQARLAEEIALGFGARGFRWAADAGGADQAMAGTARRLLGGDGRGIPAGRA